MKWLRGLSARHRSLAPRATLSLSLTLALGIISASPAYADPPVIDGQNVVVTPEDMAITIEFTDLLVSDPDVPPYPIGFSLTVQDGVNYTRSLNTITPVADFNGVLSVPVFVNDGSSDSNIFDLQVTVSPLNDPPVIDGQNPVTTPEDTTVTIQFTDLLVTDPDLIYQAQKELGIEPNRN